MIIIAREEARFIEETTLQYYWYDWKKDEESAAFVLGYAQFIISSLRNQMPVMSAGLKTR